MLGVRAREGVARGRGGGDGGRDSEESGQPIAVKHSESVGEGSVVVYDAVALWPEDTMYYGRGTSRFRTESLEATLSFLRPTRLSSRLARSLLQEAQVDYLLLLVRPPPTSTSISSPTGRRSLRRQLISRRPSQLALRC